MSERLYARKEVVLKTGLARQKIGFYYPRPLKELVRNELWTGITIRKLCVVCV